MNKFYLSFCYIGIIAFLFWGYTVPIAIPEIRIDSLSHRFLILSPFLLLVIASSFIKKINIEVVTYFGVFIVTADYCYLIQINNNIFYSTGLYVVLTACLTIINKRWFLLFYSTCFSVYCLYCIVIAKKFINVVHWGNMLTLILIAAFFGLWRIRNLEQLESEYRSNLDKSKKLEELNNIATQAAHDIRSPAMALENFANTFSGLDPLKLKIVSDAAKRVNGIADYLVLEYRNHFSNKIDKGIPNNKNIFDQQTVLEIIKSLKEEKLLLQSDFRKYKINIHGDIAYKIRDLKLQFELKRALSNIINNSIEVFQDSLGVIDFILNEDTDSCFIQIKDNGPGIPKYMIEKIFERGVSFNKTDGTGLGLSHARDTIEKFKGKITLSSKEGFGTLVQINIPKI